jgi:hypothetical protein
MNGGQRESVEVQAPFALSMNPATTEIAAPVIQGSFTISRAPSTGNATTSMTFTDDFQKEKHRLSGRPLRRPARCLLGSSPTSVELDPEETARRRLQDRMPPRSRIQAIIDRRAGRDQDPWLDDEYDWRP